MTPNRTSTSVGRWMSAPQPNVLLPPMGVQARLKPPIRFLLLLLTVICSVVALTGGCYWYLAAEQSAIEQRSELVTQWRQELLASINQSSPLRPAAADDPLAADFLRQLATIDAPSIRLVKLDYRLQSASSNRASTPGVTYELQGVASNVDELTNYLSELNQQPLFQQAELKLASQELPRPVGANETLSTVHLNAQMMTSFSIVGQIQRLPHRGEE